MAWQNKLEAVCAFPSIILEQIQNSWQQFWVEEKDLAENGEFETDDEELANS